VSLEVSPLLAHDTPRTVDQAQSLHRQAALDNLLIKIPGTAEGLPAIEECICAGVPVNVTLLFSARPRPTCGGGAPGSGRPEPGRGLGRLAVRVPLGQRGGRPGAQFWKDRKNRMRMRLNRTQKHDLYLSVLS
jgi:Transaldolase/Fructose-6-phosphate aldolase